MALTGTAGLEAVLRQRGPSAPGEIQRALGISQPTLSRLVRAAGERVVRLGRARATRYGAAREVRTVGHAWPVYRVAPDGRIEPVATLHALAPRDWWWEAEPAPAWLAADDATGVFADLPWFLDDLRPQGFLGRAFAARHAEALGVASDPRLWSADDVLVALLAHGDDLPGDLVLGDAAAGAVQRARLRGADGVADAQPPARYEALASAALAGEVAGSSAGGEQPKFATACRDASGAIRHVLVKFSPPIDTPVGRRWADLLRAEHLAADMLRAHALPACATAWCAGPRRVFLEATRFDRIGADGRRGAVSLLAVAMARGLSLDTWAAAGDALARDGWLTRADADALRVLWWFGRLIANSDQHFANISLLRDERLPLALAPAYDMLPMHYRPTPAGEIVDRPFEPPLAPPRDQTAWEQAADLAIVYWQRVGTDAEVSAAFRAIAASNAAAVQHARQRLGGAA